MIAGFRHEADENCALLDYYFASSGKFLTSFRRFNEPVNYQNLKR